MSLEEQYCIIEKLMADFSSTVQSISRALNDFAIPPPSDKGDGTNGDEKDSDEETSGGKEENGDELTNKVLLIQDIDNAPHKSDLQLEQATLASQLLTSGNDTVQNYKMSDPQETPTPFDIQECKDVTTKDEITSKYRGYAFSPLKLIIDKLIMMHFDIYPNEICPTVNRSPSFIGISTKKDGLLSRQHSSNLDILHLHPTSTQWQQQPNPLAKYSYKSKMADHHNIINCDEVEVNEQQQEQSVTDVSANNIEDSVQVPNKTPKKPSRFKRFTSYLERKLHPKKKVVVPSIGWNTQPVAIMN